MQIWSVEIKELETLYTYIKGQFPELEKELEQLIRTEDANVVMLYSRRCLEVIITDLCECELGRPRKTEPLKGIIDKLNREDKVPSHIITSMHSLNSLSTYGAHPKEFDPEQVKPVLNNLTTIIKWYLKYKDAQTISKAKPEEETKHEIKGPDNSKETIRISKKRLIIMLSGSFLVCVIIIVALFVFNIIGGGKQTKELEKSIAVLPFINDSPDEENVYFINGIMEEILNNLQTIKDLRVISRSSVEQYRGPTRPTSPTIAKTLGVNYIVEGSGQKYGNTFRLRVQLIEAVKDRHLWAESYEQEIHETKDIFGIQSQIAQAIAKELKAIITPEEKQLIDKTSTTNLTAYDFYQRGKEEYIKYWIDSDNRAALEKAEDFYHQALEYDPTFAQAYTGLARVYYDKHYWETYYTQKFLDSVPVLCDIALSYDNQVAEAYIVRGNYYRAKGISDKAAEEYDKALKINLNSWEAYYGMGNLYWNDDLLKTIDNYQKAASLNRGSELPSLLRSIGYAYDQAGFKEKADNYCLEALKLDGDSSIYFEYLCQSEFWSNNLNKSVKLGEKAFAMDSTNAYNLWYLGFSYSMCDQFEESLKYFKKYIAILETFPEENRETGSEHRVGYAFWQNGYRKEAEYYFNKQMEHCHSLIKFGRSHSQLLLSYYDIAAIYALRGEKDKAYENLKIFNQRQMMPLWAVTLIKKDPLFNSIRDEPEFQQIAREIEAKYQTEHERVRKWLEEQGML